MKKLAVSIEAVDALLPQTQCGDCEYAGCLPYAKAIVEQGEVLDKCLPGGVQTLEKLGELCEQEVSALIPGMANKTKTKRLAVIEEDLCIGCTKCIQACPVDAIFGAAKYMHTVIASECTGCELCIAPCPMDCIHLLDTEDQSYQADHARERFQQRQQRLSRLETAKQQRHQQAKLTKANPSAQTTTSANKADDKKAAIAAAIARAKARKPK